jgi:Ala-tRNA(Pro) deacylase
MSIASTVRSALSEEKVEYQVLSQTTHAGHKRGPRISPDKLARAVLLKDSSGFLLAVLPASRRLDMDALSVKLHRRLRPASDDDLDRNFFDCEVGAVPPLGPWYRLPTVVDEALRNQPDIFFEAGDRRELVHVAETAFELLMDGAEYLHFTNNPVSTPKEG